MKKIPSRQNTWALYGIPTIGLIAFALLYVSPGGASAEAPGSTAAVLETVDYVFPDPNTELGEPDPSVWSSSGNLNPAPVVGVGLQIADPDNNASLLYFHSTSNLGVATNTATWQAFVSSPFLNDVSTAWFNDATGFRLILDDGQKQLILGLGRHPTSHARQLVVLGASGVTPIPFPWDNNFHNLYEIKRLATGDFIVTATNTDPNSTDPPVSQAVPASALPPSTGPAMFAFGMGAAGGGVSRWQEVHGLVETADGVPALGGLGLGLLILLLLGAGSIIISRRRSAAA